MKEDGGKDGATLGNPISPFSKASAHPSLSTVDAADQENGKEEIAEHSKAVDVVGVGEKDDADEYEFDEWPINSQFNNDLDLAIDELLADPPAIRESELQVSQGLTTTTAAPDPGNDGVTQHGPEEEMEVNDGQTEGAGMSRKRPHPDSDDCNFSTRSISHPG